MNRIQRFWRKVRSRIRRLRWRATPSRSVGAPDPQMWLWSAERLFYGGQQLWDIAASEWPIPTARRHPAAPGQFGTALLLFGYAVENALKGLFAQRGETRESHKLRQLAIDLGLWSDLDPEQRDLLVRIFGIDPSMPAYDSHSI